MPFTKLLPSSIDLAQTFAFTGTVTGAGGGKVLQVVSSTFSTQTDSSSRSFADTGMSISITPSSTSSKILVFANHTGLLKESSDNAGEIQLGRTISGGSYSSIRVFDSNFARNNSTALNVVGGTATSCLDSPNTTSAVTYKTRFRCVIADASAVRVQQDNCVASMTAMEISA